MPSRFEGLAPHSLAADSRAWDPYDDVPLDPSYVPPVSLMACTPNLTNVRHSHEGFTA